MTRRGLCAFLAAALVFAIGTTSLHAQATPTVPVAPGASDDQDAGAEEAPPEASYVTALLTAADVPAGLRLAPDESGRLVVPGLSGRLVTFVHADTDETPELTDLLDLPAGTVLLVKNSVQQLTPEALTPGVLDSVISGAQAAAAAGGAVTDATTDYADLSLGEESRGHSAQYHLPDLPPAASTIIVFRRGDVIAALNVEAAGGDPPFELAMRLAQVVDARLAAVLGPATTPPAPTATALTPTPPPVSPLTATPPPPAPLTTTPTPTPLQVTPTAPPR
ncbi:MAG TPA: hypothetical protein VK066_05665 [Chloroflexota bacterium]|nr:hypothetical protein [Chloroflexota bacterium]